MLQWDFVTAWAGLLMPVPAHTPGADRTDPAGGGSVRGQRAQDQLVQPQSWTVVASGGHGQGIWWIQWFRRNSSAFKTVPDQWKYQIGSNSHFCLAVKSFARSGLGLASYRAACMTHLCHSLSEQGALLGAIPASPPVRYTTTNTI